MKRTFEMNGKKYDSMMDIARELGKKRIYPKDFDKYGITETTGVEVPVEEVTEAPVDPVDPVEEVTEAPVVSKTSKRLNKMIGTPEQINEVQNSIAQMTIVEFNDKIKHFSLEALIKMAEAVNINTWETISEPRIRRMRLFMELKKYYYPNDKIPVNPGSCWRGIPLDELMEFALNNSISFKQSKNDTVQRMYVIMSLNRAEFTRQDYDNYKKG